MNQKEYSELLFHNLKENIGNVITCIMYDHGIKKKINGILKEVCDKYYISLGNDKEITDVIPFIGSGIAILAVFNENELLYLNNKIEDGYNVIDKNKITKLRQEKFESMDDEMPNYSLNELKNLYVLFKIVHYSSMISFKNEDNALCLIKEEKSWKVYININGKIDYDHSFENITEACMYAITLMCDRLVMQKELICEFANGLRKQYSNEELMDFQKNIIYKERQYIKK